MANESPGHTLQATALVHEAYLRLVKSKSARWENRRHFFAAASESMRRILIERARRYQRLRHGGNMARVPFDEANIQDEQRSERLLALDESLVSFEARHPRKAQVVKLRYFVGLSIEETAEALDVSLTTVKEDWRFARAWLSRNANGVPPNQRKTDAQSGTPKPEEPEDDT